MTFAEYEPQLAKRSATIADAPTGAGVLEPKLDGWRLVAHVTEDGVELYSRKGLAYSGKLPRVEAELARFPAGTVLDGEALAVDIRGDRIVHRWGAVQSVLGSTTHPDRDRITFVVFDVLALAGRDARPVPLRQRRQVLEQLFEEGDFEALQLIDQLPATEDAYQQLLALGYEGGVVKDLDSRYASGARGAGWYKVKPTETTDAFVLGFDEGKNGLTGRLGALRLAQVDAAGSPVEIGTCGSGISDALRDEIDADRAAWIGRVVEVAQLGGSGGDNWRPFSFRRLRDDKAPEQCTR